MFVIVYAIFMLICLGIMTILKKFNAKQTQIIILFVLVLFSLMMGLRPVNSKDTLQYITIFDNLKGNVELGFSLFQKYKGFEYGFIYLIKFFQLFSNNYRIFFFLVALTINLISFYSLEKICYSDSIKKVNGGSFFLLFLYIGSYGLLYSGIAIRAGLSLAFGLLVIVFFMKFKYAKGIIFLLLSFAFHRMGLIFLLIFLIIKLFPQLNKKTYIYVYICLVFLFLTGFSNYIFQAFLSIISYLFAVLNINGFSSYLNVTETAIGIIDVYWILYTLSLILLFNKNKAYRVLLNVAMFGMIIIVFLHGIRAINRVYDYFFILSIPLLCDIFYRIPHVFKFEVFNKKVTINIEKTVISLVTLCNIILAMRICFL